MGVNERWELSVGGRRVVEIKHEISPAKEIPESKSSKPQKPFEGIASIPESLVDSAEVFSIVLIGDVARMLPAGMVNLEDGNFGVESAGPSIGDVNVIERLKKARVTLLQLQAYAYRRWKEVGAPQDLDALARLLRAAEIRYGEDKTP